MAAFNSRSQMETLPTKRSQGGLAKLSFGNRLSSFPVPKTNDMNRSCDEEKILPEIDIKNKRLNDFEEKLPKMYKELNKDIRQD